MGTKADAYHASIKRVLESGSTEEIAMVASRFYRSVRFDAWLYAGVEVYERGGNFTVRVKWNGDQLVLDFDGKRWSGRGWVSTAEIAEALGVPVAYVEGVEDALSGFEQTYYAGLAKREAVLVKREAVLASIKKKAAELRKQRKAFEDESAMVKAAVRRETQRCRRQFGQTTAQEIAKLREKLTVQDTAKVERSYPEIPQSVIEAPQKVKGSAMPEISGVYFVWCDGEVQYVGQSINLQKRVTLSHEKIFEGDRISWLPFETWQLNFAESYYIGIAMPSRNFGSRR